MDQNNITTTASPVTPVAPTATEVKFLELGPAELDALEDSYNFIMPMVVEVKERFGALPSAEELKSWIDSKIKQPGLKIPASLKILNVTDLRDGIADEIQLQFANKATIEKLKSQILEGFNEIVDNIPYGESDELVYSLDGFSGAIDGLIEQNENNLTEIQKYELWSLKQDLAKITKLVATTEPDSYDTLIAMGALRHKLGQK